MQFELNYKKSVFILAVLILILSVLVFLFFMFNRQSITKQQATQKNGITYLFSIYGFGKKPGESLSRPNGIAINKKNGNIYITDQGNDRVLVFNEKGKFQFKFGKKGNKKGELKAPMCITVGAGKVFVTDRIQNKILIYNENGKFINEFKVNTPLTPFINGDRLFVTTNTNFIMFDLNGKKLAQWGSAGSKKDEFNFPNGITIDKNDIFYLADSNNIRVKALNRSGETIWTTAKFSKKRKGDRIFGLPIGITIDEKNRLYVVDAFPGSIKVLDKNGKFITSLGKSGNKDAEFYLPAQIAYAGNRVFYIADKYNNRVQAVKIP